MIVNIRLSLGNPRAFVGFSGSFIDAYCSPWLLHNIHISLSFGRCGNSGSYDLSQLTKPSVNGHFFIKNGMSEAFGVTQHIKKCLHMLLIFSF